MVHTACSCNAIVNENSFAELLDRRLKRIAEMKLIEAQPNAIERAWSASLLNGFYCFRPMHALKREFGGP